MYFYRPPSGGDDAERGRGGHSHRVEVVNRIRERVKEWRAQQWRCKTRTTLERCTTGDETGDKSGSSSRSSKGGRTIIFLTEMRVPGTSSAGIGIPFEQPQCD